MIDHDRNVGQLLDLLDELGVAENTIVIYSTDNGPHANSWPDGATTPFRSEKNTNWEGAFRVPQVIGWPGKITARSVSNEIIQHHDWLKNVLGRRGEPDIGKVKPRQQTSRRHSRLRSSLPNVAGAGGVTSSTLPIPVACRSKQCVQALPVCGIECTAGRMLFECDS